MTKDDLAVVARLASSQWVAWCPNCGRRLELSKGRAAMVVSARAHNDLVHGVYETDEQFEARMRNLVDR